MAAFIYKGREHEISSQADVLSFMQLLATDLGSKFYQDANRDLWLRDFATDVSAKFDKMRNSVPPVSLLSLFASKTKQLPASTVQPTPTTVVPAPSPHRIPGPTAESLDAAVTAIDLTPESTDRAHFMTVLFDAAFSAVNNVGEVTFRTPYSSAPVVTMSQTDLLPWRNFRVVAVSATGYVFTCDDFSAAELHRVQTTVVHPTDSFD